MRKGFDGLSGLVRNEMFSLQGAQSAQRIAMMYTITSTCKKLDINPQQDIEYLLTELPYRKANDIDDLLPWNYKARDLSTELANQNAHA